MGTIQLSNNTTTTTISNVFINSIMPIASGEFIKVYLYLLMTSQSSSEFSIPEIADKFSMTEGDIIRSLKFWQDKKVLKLSFSSQHELSSIDLLEPIVEQEVQPVDEYTGAQIITKPFTTKGLVKPRYTQQELETLTSTEEIRELLYMTEMGIGKPLSDKDMRDIVYISDGLKLPFDVIEYLIEYCVSSNHRKMSYILATAQNWSEEEINTVEKAKQNAILFNKNYFAVMKAFGITNRNPSDYELPFLQKWFKEYGFDLSIVQEACSRTIKLTHQPSFDYADSILSAWHGNNVITLNDIAVLDQSYNKTKVKVSSNTSDTTKVRKTINKFNNFQQREYDYDILEKKLAQKQMQM